MITALLEAVAICWGKSPREVIQPFSGDEPTGRDLTMPRRNDDPVKRQQDRDRNRTSATRTVTTLRRRWPASAHQTLVW
jgi:hypothetical protein